MTRFLAVICLALIVWEPAYSLAADAEITWDGVLAFFVVPRQRVIDKLEQLQAEGDTESCVPNRLALPEESFLPNKSNHVVAVSFGTLNDVRTAQFFIPYLRDADDVNGAPIYKLSLQSYVDEVGTRQFDNPNPCIPVRSADLVHIGTDVQLEVGRYTLLITISPPDNSTHVDLDLPANSPFEEYNAQYAVSSECGCSCQNWTHEPLEERKAGSVGIGAISNELSEITLLTADSKALRSVANVGNFTAHTVDACFD